MKPFNLQEALAGKPVVTRDGRKATDIHHCPTASLYVAVGVVSGTVLTFTEEGRFNRNSRSQECLDLFMASEKKRGWVNIFRIGGRICTGDVHETEAEAGDYYGGHGIATVPIEWEE